MNTDLQAALRARGAVFFSGFGALWLLAWAYFGGHPAVAALIVPVAAVLLWTGVRRARVAPEVMAAFKTTPPHRRGQRVFLWTNIGQWLGVFIGVNVLNNTGLGTWAMPLVVMIVGLHMFPLAWAFHNRPHLVTGTALVLLAITGPFIAAGGPADTVISAWTGLILWLSAAWALRPHHAQPLVLRA